MLTPANTSDVHQLMTDFGLWARVRPEGALTRTFWDETSAKTYTMTDEDGLFLDGCLLELTCRNSDLATMLLLRYVRCWQYRAIGMAMNIPRMTVYESIEKARVLLLEIILSRRDRSAWKDISG